MEVFNKNKTLKGFLSKISNEISVGFVPTMGALHKGHLSLIERAKEENDVVVVSIFVNPTQFDNKEDLVKYPKNLDKDLEFLENVNCDAVFAPNAIEIYQNKIQAESFDFDGLEHEMEGKHRNGHFDGVGTIVKKLLEIVNPDKAYFGEKDFQQLQIIKKLVEKCNLPVEIIGCAIFREKDGLAMSSRNTRLTKTERAEAPFIYKTLKAAKNLEYFEIANETTLKPDKQKMANDNYRAFLAVFAGEIRLIDNIAL
ncbi:UNVERIFIED_CONTAM: hypothetical protein GTU68_020871 [Idotea baltica]|nr:hypothetical protein [Idotea baltica]